MGLILSFAYKLKFYLNYVDYTAKYSLSYIDSFEFYIVVFNTEIGLILILFITYKTG